MTVVTLAVTDFRLLIYLFIYYRFHRIPKNRFTQAKYHSSGERNMSSRPVLRHIKRSLICNSQVKSVGHFRAIVRKPFLIPATTNTGRPITHSLRIRKSGNGLPLVRHGYHSCDLGKSAMLSAQLYVLCFQAL